MAAKKRKGHQKPLTAQQRVKRSQNAKKRIRGVDGRFLDGLRASGAYQAAQEGRYGPKKDNTTHSPRAAGSTGRTKGNFAEGVREVGQQARSDVSRLPREKLEQELAYRRTRDITGSQNVREFDVEHAPVRTTSSQTDAAVKQYREANWDKGDAFKTSTPKTQVAFLSSAPKALQDEVKQLSSPTGAFGRGGVTSHAVRRRQGKYTQARQAGMSHKDAINEAVSDRRGKRTGAAPKKPAARTTGRERPKADTRSRRGKYDSATPRGANVSMGVSAQAVDTLGGISDQLPDLSDKEVIRVQQAQRENVWGDFLTNQKWAHETKRANILGDKSEDLEKQSEDKVTFFTTSLGGPSPSVPSDSLIGQYIIRKRKGMMKDAGVPNSQLRGEFPRAVRDMHIFEWSTGVSYGIQGEAGAFKQTGFRNRNKGSKGFGKPRPLGSHILTGADGRPVYDNNGNIRYGEGATRPVDYRTPNLGLRIFLG